MDENDDILAKVCARFQEKLEICERDLEFSKIWIESLGELSEIEKAFDVDNETDKLHDETILDIGTCGVKPLYIALKYEPSKIIGISDDLDSYTEEIMQNSNLFVKTELQFYQCNFFNDEKLNTILVRENQQISDYVLVSKTLHHLRTGKCIARDRDNDHCCRLNEEKCIYLFEEKTLFKNLLERARKRLIVYEWFDPGEPDNDKVRGRGGYFALDEWERIFRHLAENYKVELIQPIRCLINVKVLEKVMKKLRQVDTICFYVERVDVR